MAPQTSYDVNMPVAHPGQLADIGPHYIESFSNGESSTNLLFGHAVKVGSTEGECAYPSAVTDKIAGITVHTHALSKIGQAGSQDHVVPDATVGALRLGSCYALPEQTVAKGDPVYYRITSDGGSNTVLGRLRKDADSGRAVRLLGAEWMTAGGTSAPAKLWVNMGGQPVSVAALTEAAGAIGGTSDGDLPALTDLTMGTNVTAATANGSLEDSASTNPTEANFNNNMKELGVRVNALGAAVRELATKVNEIASKLKGAT